MSSENPEDDFVSEEDDELTKDVRLEMKIKNNILWKEIHKKFRSVSELCRANESLGLNQGDVGKLLALKVLPFFYRRVEKNSKTLERVYRKSCVVLEKALGLPAEVLFPEELYQRFVGTETSKAIEMSSFSALPAPEKQKLLFLPAPEPSPISGAEMNELRERIDSLLLKLTPRQRKIIKLRFGFEGDHFYTYKELGSMFGISKNRVRDIEHSVIRKIRSTPRRYGLLSFKE
ncbi:MAG: sigma-70 family RNA polymerase sigma factor [Patescibacteria group bacterium]